MKLLYNNKVVSGYPLLHTKLHLPSSRGANLPRESLTAILDEGLANRCRLILVSAPAGYGKTTLIAIWLGEKVSRRDVCAAWISLENSENDPVQFWSYVIAAFRLNYADIGSESLGLLRSAQPPPMPVILTTLLNEVSLIEKQVILVLDDYHNIQNPAIHEGITFWLEHLPENIHLVIATRTDPFLPLSVFRARRLMTELRLNHLRFSLEEEKDFFRLSTGLDLNETEVRLLEKSTEGWAAGLQLAALSFKTAFKDSSCGESRDLLGALEAYDSSNRHLLDFFSEEILRSISPELQLFLVCSSIFDRFCADLCDLSLKTERSSEIISELERNNLFIIPLDMNRHWYRYHHLFSDLLRQRLKKQITSDELAGLHRRAASWFEANSFDDEAVDHYIKGIDYANAARILERVSFFRLFSGEGETISRWLASFPSEWRQQHPGLLVVEAWMNLTALKFQETEQFVQLAERYLVDRAEEYGPSLLNSLRGQIEAIRTTSFFNTGDIAHTLEHAVQALKDLPPSEEKYRCLVYNCLGDIYFTQGKIVDANQYYEQAYTAARSGRIHLITHLAGSMYGNTTASLGQLQKAAAIFKSLVEQVRAGEIALLPAYAAVEEGYARLLLEQNKLQEAFAYAEQALDRISLWDHAEISERALLTLTEVAWAMGDVVKAENYLEDARKLYKERLSIWPYPRLPLVEAQLLVRQKNPEKAEEVLRTAGLWPQVDRMDEYSFIHSTGYAPAISILLSRGQFDSALRISDAARQMAKERKLLGLELQIRLLQALAQGKLGQKEEAIDTIQEVLSFAAQQGYCRVFLNGGKDVAALLTQWLKESTTNTTVARYVSSILESFGRDGHPKSTSEKIRVDPEYESLSPREIEILKLVAAGLPNDDIASTLYLSSNTVKTHIKRIFSKLYVHNRLEAVNRARELNLL